jgi:uracil phosphoribosyltransferase
MYVSIFLAALDERLIDHAYVFFGLGSARDRVIGTKYKID